MVAYCTVPFTRKAAVCARKLSVFFKSRVKRCSSMSPLDRRFGVDMEMSVLEHGTLWTEVK